MSGKKWKKNPRYLKKHSNLKLMFAYLTLIEMKLKKKKKKLKRLKSNLNLKKRSCCDEPSLKCPARSKAGGRLPEPCKKRKQKSKRKKEVKMKRMREGREEKGERVF